jgi:NADH-quinone oxidoreductase subunit M
MLSHGIISAALFLCVGVLYDRVHTRLIGRYGGLVNRMPMYSFTFMVFILAGVGLPATTGFVGEFLTIVGAYQVSTWVAVLMATGVVLGAAYSLWLYRRVIFGELTKPELKEILDLNRREILIFAPLVVLAFWFGIYPGPVLDILHVSVGNLIEHHQTAMAAFADAAIPAPELVVVGEIAGEGTP